MVVGLSSFFWIVLLNHGADWGPALLGPKQSLLLLYGFSSSFRCLILLYLTGYRVLKSFRLCLGLRGLSQKDKFSLSENSTWGFRRKPPVMKKSLQSFALTHVSGSVLGNLREQGGWSMAAFWLYSDACSVKSCYHCWSRDCPKMSCHLENGFCFLMAFILNRRQDCIEAWVCLLLEIWKLAALLRDMRLKMSFLMMLILSFFLWCSQRDDELHQGPHFHPY